MEKDINKSVEEIISKMKDLLINGIKTPFLLLNNYTKIIDESKFVESTESSIKTLMALKNSGEKYSKASLRNNIDRAKLYINAKREAAMPPPPFLS